MPTLKVLQNNFTTGEISPQVRARIDLSKYEGACKLIKNAIPMAQGGVTKRPGTLYVDEAEDGFLIPFAYSETQTYALLFMNYKIRFYTNGGVVKTGDGPNDPIYELATEYPLADLAELKFAQTMDMMYLVHPNHPPRKLCRYGHANWEIENVQFVPSIESPEWGEMKRTGWPDPTPTGYLETTTEYKVAAVNVDGEESMPSPALEVNTLSTWPQGARITLKWEPVPEAVRYEVYKNAHGWFEWAGSTQETEFVDDNIEADGSVSPKEYRNPFEAPTAPVAPTVTGGTAGVQGEDSFDVCVTAVNTGGAESMPSATTTTVTVSGETVTLNAETPDDIELYNFYIRRNGGQWSCTTQVPDTTNPYKLLTTFDGETVVAEYLYDNSYTGKYFRWKLTGSPSGTHTTPLYTKRKKATSRNALWKDPTCTIPTTRKKILKRIDGGNVTFEMPVNTHRGEPPTSVGCYPGAVGIYQQRLMFGRTDRNPQTVWMSETGAYNSMAVSHPLRDDSAITVMVDTRKRNEIRHFVSLSDAFVFTDATEFRMTDKDGVITPGTIGFRPQSYWGSSHVPPIVVGTTILMVDGTGRVVRDVHYNLQEDGYSGDNRSILAEHLFLKPIRDWSYQQIPFSTVYAVREDGKLLTFTYMREQEIWAWAQHESDGGEFRSVCTVRENGKDLTWFLVKRGNKYFVEEQKLREFGDPSTDSWFVDCGLEYDEETATSTVEPSHLKGKEVYGIADGSLIGPFTVPETGVVTLPRPAKHVILGLPYSMEVRTIDPDIKGDDGTRFGKTKTVGPVTLELLETASVEAGADENHLETFKIPCHDEWGAPIVLFSGKFRAPTPGFARDEASVLIRSRDPFPATVLAVKTEVRAD